MDRMRKFDWRITLATIRAAMLPRSSHDEGYRDVEEAILGHLRKKRASTRGIQDDAFARQMKIAVAGLNVEENPARNFALRCICQLLDEKKEFTGAEAVAFLSRALLTSRDEPFDARISVILSNEINRNGLNPVGYTQRIEGEYGDRDDPGSLGGVWLLQLRGGGGPDECLTELVPWVGASGGMWVEPRGLLFGVTIPVPLPLTK